MTTIQDVINELLKIREAIDSIVVRGRDNAALVCYACGKCDDLVENLKETVKQIQNESKDEPQIIVTEAGDENGEFDRELS